MTTLTPVNLKGSDYVLLEDRGIYVTKERHLQGYAWDQAHRTAHVCGMWMPILPVGVAFLKLMLSSKPVYDGNGKRLNAHKKAFIADDMVGMRDSAMGEWFDARFENIGGTMVVHYNHSYVCDELKPLNTEPLEECLMEDRWPGIDLSGWLRHPTEQGLPRKTVKRGDLWYSYPRDGGVARFDASLDGDSLNCDVGPQDSYSGLGVRLVVSAESADFEK